jgi:hypothetical protein
VSIRRIVIVVVLAATAGGFAPAARSDGLPVLGVDVGASGVAAPSGSVRYVTIPAPGGTMVERIQRAGGRVLAAVLVPGTYTIPAVAYDGSASGLSGDRHTLVLIEPRRSFPRANTTLLVLTAPNLAHRAVVRLHGDFSFDAISPDGSRLYLIQYLSPADPTRYAVRSFELSSMRLAPRPVVDPREPDEAMRGNPLSRAVSADGRWAYTLYDGGGTHPFIHALDTARSTARCIDVAGLAPAILSRIRLRMADGGRDVQIADGARTLVAVDTRMLTVRAPAGPRSWRLPAFLAGAGGLVVVGVGFGLVLLRRRRPVQSPVPVD